MFVPKLFSLVSVATFLASVSRPFLHFHYTSCFQFITYFIFFSRLVQSLADLDILHFILSFWLWLWARQGYFIVLTAPSSLAFFPFIAFGMILIWVFPPKVRTPETFLDRYRTFLFDKNPAPLSCFKAAYLTTLSYMPLAFSLIPFYLWISTTLLIPVVCMLTTFPCRRIQRPSPIPLPVTS